MKSRKYIVEFVLYSVYLVFGAVWATTGSVTPQIMHDFNLGITDASMMTNAILWAKIVGAVATAFVTYSLGVKRSYLLGLCLIGTSIVIPMINSFYPLIIIRFMNGLGGAICLVSLVPVVSRYFDTNMSAKVNSFNGTSNIVGSIIALTLAVKLSDALGGWKVLLASYGWITLALAVVWMFFFQDFEQDPNAQNNADTKKEELRIALTSRITWGMIVQYVGGLLMMLAAFTYLPTYYAKYAHFGADSVAHYAPSANQAGIMVAAFVSMWLKSLGIHYKKMFGITSILMAILIMIMLFSTNDYIVLACSFGAGFLLATWFAFIFALPKEEIRGATTNVITYVMSTFWFFSFSVAAINNQIIGHLVDQSGSFTSAFVYIIGVMVIAPIAAQFIFPKAK